LEDSIAKWKNLHIEEADNRYEKCKRDRLFVKKAENWTTEEQEENAMSNIFF